MVTWLVNWGVLSLSNHEQFIRKSCNHQRFVKFFILYWSLDDKKLHHLIIKHNLLGYHNHKEYMIKRLFKIAEKWSFKHLLIIKLLVEMTIWQQEDLPGTRNPWSLARVSPGCSTACKTSAAGGRTSSQTLACH